MCTKDNRIINGLQLEINSALLEYLSWCCLKKKLKRVRKIYYMNSRNGLWYFI